MSEKHDCLKMDCRITWGVPHCDKCTPHSPDVPGECCLWAEVSRLTAELHEFRDGATAEADAGDAARAEVARLTAALATLKDANQVDDLIRHQQEIEILTRKWKAAEFKADELRAENEGLTVSYKKHYQDHIEAAVALKHARKALAEKEATDVWKLNIELAKRGDRLSAERDEARQVAEAQRKALAEAADVMRAAQGLVKAQPWYQRVKAIIGKALASTPHDRKKAEDANG